MTTPPPSSELPEVTVEPIPAPEPKAKEAVAKPEPRPLLARLFGISIWGGLKLIGLCILVGFFRAGLAIRSDQSGCECG